MPDMLEQFAEETINNLLKKLPAEKRLQGLPAEERLRGLSADELLAALSPETRAALARRLKDENPLPGQGGKGPDHDERQL